MSHPTSTTEVVPFDYDTHQVRTLVIDGEPWFILADLCKVLGIGNARDVAARLADDQKGVDLIDTPGGRQKMTIVNEPGMYEVVIRSDKPEAVAFRRWLTGEVLPQIRKTGSYGAPTVRELSRLELIQLAMNAETERLALEQKNAKLAPKAEAFESFIDAAGHYSIASVAKMLGSSQNKLFRDLRNAGVFIAKGSQRNTPYQKYMHHFVVKAHEYEHKNGEMGCSYTTYVQPSGIDFIRRKLELPSFDPIPGLE